MHELAMASKPLQVVALVQYVALRGDLADKWPLGALIAQACHASSAALHLFKDDSSTQNYLADIDSMHKVVLRVNTEEELISLSKKLEEDGKGFKLWVEKPENYPTCLATKPYPKADIQDYFKKFKLLK